MNQLVELEQKDMGMVLQHSLPDMLEQANALVVEDAPSFRAITALYSHARDLSKKLEARRKQLCEPARRTIANVNDAAKYFSDQLDAVISVAKSKADGYRVILEKKELEKKEALEKAAALLDVAVPISAQVDTSIRGQGAMAYTKVTKRFRVTDMQKVPERYLQVNESLVMLDIKMGIAEIPGIEVYEEKTTQLRVR